MAPHSISQTYDAESANNAKDALLLKDRGDKHGYSRVLQTFRILIADLCQQFNGGHPGGAIGMAAIGVALWKYVMRYSPTNPTFFNRDRFVLSNGHTCLFQYSFLHLTGYPSMTMDQLKSYHSKRWDALCPGHPEIEHEGIEDTTGPLGQGIANAVGMAAASKHLGAKFNKPDYSLVSNHIWCMVGDACLQEGVALEAISLAGHWKLNNLTVIYDNNQITCDGTVDITNTEDINKKMEACGWEVIEVEDGCYDVARLVEVLTASRSSELPTFVNVKTVIGLDSAVAGKAVAHGAAFGVSDVAAIKQRYGFDPEEHFVVPQDVYNFFSESRTNGDRLVKEWEELLRLYSAKYPELGESLQTRLRGEMASVWQALIPQEFPSKATATRASSGLVFNPIAEAVDSFFVGTADLTPSVNMSWKTKEAFQCPSKSPGSYAGSFFMFYLYAAPAVRMGALQNLQVIHAATHDSIGMGEDGPTHQPIELAALYRTMPNLLYIRPADSEEVAGAWTTAIKSKNAPTIISTSRHAVPQLTPLTKRQMVAKGAYVLEEVQDAQLTIIGVGAELNLALDVARALTKLQGIKTRVVSFPCQRLFDRQPSEYKRSVLQRSSARPIVVIEQYAANGWERYATTGVCMSTDRFGQSLPGQVAYEYFGFTTHQIVPKIAAYMERLAKEPELIHEFCEMTEAAGVAKTVFH